ncbi:hypothetical protein FD755_010628 [Muntiacus reevesi]|uniref:Uncharacterized protein n=1 Tax=Muntiacus reevesi TaxID=9886 RepID=A0A5N3XZ06_MUNRE|nr:hypothetical protein FD755_010628 [Muntiacus reevesi]
MPAPATTYERIVYKNPSEYHYMKVRLEFQDCGVGLNAAQFKQLLISALKDLFGEGCTESDTTEAIYHEDFVGHTERTFSQNYFKTTFETAQAEVHGTFPYISLQCNMTLVFQSKKCEGKKSHVPPILVDQIALLICVPFLLA